MSATNQFPPPYFIPENGDDALQEKGAAQENDSMSTPNGTKVKQKLTLPATDTNSSSEPHNLSRPDEYKQTISFGNLGPLVINKDGTLSRIHNWTQMTDSERERTVRVLGKRNMLRKEAILREDNQ